MKLIERELIRTRASIEARADAPRTSAISTVLYSAGQLCGEETISHSERDAERRVPGEPQRQRCRGASPD